MARPAGADACDTGADANRNATVHRVQIPVLKRFSCAAPLCPGWYKCFSRGILGATAGARETLRAARRERGPNGLSGQRADDSGGRKRVLVVDDEDGILELVEYHLRRAGYVVSLADTGLEGYRLATDGRPDLVILDLMLPDMDGFEVCRRIRRHSDVPVLMLTARTDDVDKIVGLEIGADDYVTKPFNPRELVARVRALLRRVGDGPDGLSERRVFGDLSVDLLGKEIRLAGEPLPLSPTEFALLQVFVEGPGRVWSRDELLDRVWGEDFVGDPRVVDVYVRYLREKLGDDAANPRWLETVRGMGYRWRGVSGPSRGGARDA